MKNKYKTKKQLIEELEALQKQVDKLKKTETRAKQAGKPSLAAQYWQTMFDTINDAVSIIDRNGKITQCNKTMASLLQKPMSEIIGRKCWELVHGSTKPIPKCPIARMKKSLKRETLTLPLMGRWFEVTTDPIIDKRGKLAGAVHIIVDITERKQMEEELKIEQYKLREYFENLPLLAYNISFDGTIVDCNNIAVRTLGYDSKEELIGKSLIDTIYAPSSQEKAKQLFEKWKKEGKLKNEELQIITKQGKIIDILLNVDTIFDHNGIPLNSLSTQLDITERKKAEEALQFTRFSLDNAADVMICVDRDARFIDVNDACCRSWGYSREELLSMSVHDIDPDYSAEIWPEFWEKLKQSGSLTFESCHRTKKGKVYPVEIVANFFEYNGKEYHCSFARDITERKQAEEALQKSEARYRDLYDNAPDMYHTLDENGVILNCNETETRMLGYEKKEIIGKHITDFFTEESKRLFETDFPKLKKESKLLNMEREFVRKDGTIFPAMLNVFSEYDEKGKFVGTKTISRDVTIQKRAEIEILKAKEFSDSLITLMQDGFSVLDSHGVHINVNPALCQMTGFSREELIGTGLPHPYWPPEEHKKIERAFQKTLRGKFGDFELTFMRKNGERFPAIVSPSHIKDEQGNIINYFATIKDITERKRAEVEYKTIIYTALDGFWVVNMQGRFLDVNNAYCNLIGYRRDELLNMKIPDLEAIEKPEETAARIRKIKEVGGDRFETRHRCKDGRIVDIEVCTNYMDIEGGRMFVFLRNITNRKRMEEELKRSNEMKIFGQLAAGVAHEVRNPLNAILAITEALFQDIGDNPEYLPYLEHIQNQVNRLSILMKDLLEIGKPISHDSFQPETVARIVTSTIDFWGMLDLSKKYSLRYISHPESEKLYVKTEIARLQQVVLNLLQNAAQNSPEGSEIVIQVLEPRDKTVNIHIIDRGTGIPHDNLLYVFEPFFTTQKGGTGLGLSIVKHFVESMGGEVAIWNNDPPPGCTVELRLPIFKDSRKIEIENNSHKNSPPLAGGDKGEG